MRRKNTTRRSTSCDASRRIHSLPLRYLRRRGRAARRRDLPLRCVAPAVNQGLGATAYGKLADALAAAVERTRPEVARFLAVLRNPQGRSFDVAPEGNTEKIFRSVPAETITISCAPSVPQYLVEVATAALLAERIRIEHELPAMKTRAAILEKASRDAETCSRTALPCGHGSSG